MRYLASVLPNSLRLLLLFGSIAVAVYMTFRIVTAEDLTKSESSLCEVHRIKMKAKLVPIRYGLPMYPSPLAFGEGYVDAIGSFPHAPDHVSGGCVVRSKTRALVFSCPRCEANRVEWVRWLRNGGCKPLSTPVVQRRLTPDILKRGLISHQQLAPSMIAKIESFRSMLADVYVMPMAEWLNGFQQYASPEREMKWWQRLTHCYVDYCSRKDLAPEQREAAFNVLCKLGLGATSDDITADLQNLPFGALEELVAETHHDWEVKVVGFYATPDVMRQGEKADLCYGVDNAKSVRLD